jgi:hypothetical protein
MDGFTANFVALALVAGIGVIGACLTALLTSSRVRDFFSE